MQVFIVQHLKSFRMNTYEKPRGEGYLTMPFCYSLLTNSLRHPRAAHAL